MLDERQGGPAGQTSPTPAGSRQIAAESWDTSWVELPAKARGVDVPAIAVAPSGLVYVLARAEDPVLVVDQDGRTVASWGRGDLRRPHAIMVDDQYVICVDDEGQRVVGYTLDGVRAWAIEGSDRSKETGYVPGYPHSVRAASGPFCYPTGVARRDDGDLLVSDGYGNARLHRFRGGQLVESQGRPGRGPGEFVLPHGVTVDRSRLLISDRENERIQVLDRRGRVKGEWKNVHCPNNVVRLPGNYYAVVELGRQWPMINGRKTRDEAGLRPRITVRTPDGSIVADITPPDELVKKRWFAPHGITVDDLGRIYISEVKWGYTGGDAPSDAPAITRITLRGLM